MISSETKLSNYKKTTPFILLACLTAFILKTPSFCENLEFDEAVHLFLGSVLICGDGFFSVPWTHEGPALCATFAALYGLFGTSSEAIHASAALFSLLTTLIIYFFSRILFDSRVAIFASIFFAIFSSSRSLQGTLAASEVFMLFFTTLGFYLYILYRQGSGNRLLVLSGLALGIAFLYKQTSGLDYLCLVLFILGITLYLHKGDKLRTEIIWPITLLTIGFLLPLIALTVYFLATDRLFDFVYWTFLRGIHYTKTQHAYAPGWNAFLAVVTGKTWMIWLLSLLSVIYSVLFVRSKERFLCFIWVICGIVAVSLSGWFFPHYFIQLLPAASVLAGLFVMDVYGWGRRSLSLNLYFYKNALLTVLLLASFVIYFKSDYPHAKHYFHYWTGDIDKREYLARAFNIPWKDRYDASEYLRTNMHPEETLYVWDSCTHIYLLTGKRPLTRHIYCYSMLNEDLTFPTMKGWFSYFSENRKKLMSEFYSSSPDYITVHSEPEKIFDQLQVFKEFGKFLQDRYSLVKRFGNILVFKRKSVSGEYEGAEKGFVVPVEILKMYSSITQIEILPTHVEIVFEPMVNPNGILRSFRGFYSSEELGLYAFSNMLVQKQISYRVPSDKFRSVFSEGGASDPGQGLASRDISSITEAELLRQVLRALGIEFVPISAEFMGHDGKDYVSMASFSPSGSEDLHIRIRGPSKPINFLRVKCGERHWNTKSYGVNPVIKAIQNNGFTDIYFECSPGAHGRMFEIYIIYEDGTLACTRTYG